MLLCNVVDRDLNFIPRESVQTSIWSLVAMMSEESSTENGNAARAGFRYFGHQVPVSIRISQYGRRLACLVNLSNS